MLFIRRALEDAMAAISENHVEESLSIKKLERQSQHTELKQCKDQVHQ